MDSGTRPFFDVRGTIECGWNVFHRKGYSDDPQDIAVNYDYLDHLSQAGVNYLIVFWTNSERFDEAWEKAVPYAHALEIKVARAVYGFSGGGPEHSMAEPDVPEHLLRTSSRGPDTALCPCDDETRAWFAETLKKRLEPGMDGIDIEPAREIGRHCICSECRSLHPYEWDALVINFLADGIHSLRPGAEVLLHLNTNMMKADRGRMREEYAKLRENVQHIFAWGADDEASLIDWLDLDPRFEPFAKLGRVLLFPEGKPPAWPAEERVAGVFRGCRLAADRGKTGYTFDYRIFGGREWQGHGDELPSTRVSRRQPASIAVMGAAMRDPYLDERGQRDLLDRLRAETDWDLDDPAYFWRGAR